MCRFNTCAESIDKNAYYYTKQLNVENTVGQFYIIVNHTIHRETKFPIFNFIFRRKKCI